MKRGQLILSIAIIGSVVMACATMRTPEGEQTPLMHATYRTDKHDEIRREMNFKTISNSKNPDKKMSDYKTYEGPEEYPVWGSDYTK